MKLSYKLTIETPSTHQVRIVIKGKKETNENLLDFFLPRWSPGSYLMREYSRHLSNIKAETSNGERLYLDQTDISTWRVNWDKSELKKADNEFILSYSVYCHELTVRTSHVDDSHAFLHLPTLLMGVLGHEMNQPDIELVFPAAWSKLTTGLKDISIKREAFIFTAKNYDELIDSPIEIGCQETDGFMLNNIPHELCFYGQQLPHTENIKEDTKKIVDYIAHFMGGFPYEKYTIINHFVPGLYGGLEHGNSTALHYCPTQLANRKGYINYLALISHEYFHTWNVKRIRPVELGPFNYLKEATTKLLWLAEGLTSLMDELFIYRAGLISIEEYLEMQKDNFNRYLNVPGRKFHSLDESSFNAWIKLYRPDENTNNSSVSYYLKGGIVFFALNILLAQKNKSIDDFIKGLWSDYQKNPNRGVDSRFVYDLIEQIGGADVREEFETLTMTTKELDLETLCQKAGLKVEWEKSETTWLGFDPEFSGDRVSIKAIVLDGPAYQSGFNAGDEIIAINGMRMLKDRFNDFSKFLRPNQTYQVMITRLGIVQTLNLHTGINPIRIKSISVMDKEVALKTLKSR